MLSFIIFLIFNVWLVVFHTCRQMLLPCCNIHTCLVADVIALVDVITILCVFLLLTPGEDGKITTSVFRKPTHTDLYMQWDNNHDISAKYSVIGTLHHRANTISSTPELLQKEEKHLKKVLARCKYPDWAINRVKIKMRTPAQGEKKLILIETPFAEEIIRYGYC